jgi:signal transduction histidine kinase
MSIIKEAPMKFTNDELRALAILEGLPDRVLTWLSDHGNRIELATGERLFTRGHPAIYMFIVVTGIIQRYEEIGGQWLVVSTTSRGQVTGMLPFSRMTHYPGHTVATVPSQVLLLDKSHFDELLKVSHELGQRLVTVMSNRVRGDVRLEQQREKMMALGRLSAGLAHELNNPTAAIRRTSENLAARLTGQSKLILKMARRDLEKTVIDAIEQLSRVALEREFTDYLSPVDRSDREEELASWLEGQKVMEAWELASVFTDTGLSVKDFERFADAVPGDILNDGLAWVAGSVEVNRMVAEIYSSAGHISELVSSVKLYSHMDRSSEHKPTDVREGLDNTLIMLGHKLKQKKIRVMREYQDNIPIIPGNAGELNQVWTNLIDNALDALTESGELSIQIGSDDWGVAVKIIDNGAGIPEDIRLRIFDPFFTTKDVGEGTGLGLDIARRIVHTHRGQIEARSRPGRTEMFVRLPIESESSVGWQNSTPTETDSS